MYTHKNKQSICNQTLTGHVFSHFSLSFCSLGLLQFFSTPVLSRLFSFSLVAACLFLFSLPSVYTVCSTHLSIFVSLSLVSHQLCSPSPPSLIHKCNLWFLQIDSLVQLQTNSCVFGLTHPRAVCNIIIFYSDCFFFCYQFTHTVHFWFIFYGHHDDELYPVIQ